MEQEKPQPVVAVDPNLALEQAQAQSTLISNLQTQAQLDTADLMTRFGTKLALSGGGISPITGAPAATPPVKF